ncbi:TIGR04076 family protein [candidate division WOR-3 bacterium]|uniref:TIGR04076 family protein n=1 Tax=candidate division WOR-3 bacterium TaxID=2052148 RepID=A0A660SHK2_UNCW3|nr:MAG: TIGR04076 family protein [candidate division WOR-3 bacterium]
MLGKKVIITIIRQEGYCDAGHKVGDRFVYQGELPPICPAAWAVIYPYLRVLQFGGNFPWEKKDVCPDPENPVVFRLQREG